MPGTTSTPGLCVFDSKECIPEVITSEAIAPASFILSGNEACVASMPCVKDRQATSSSKCALCLPDFATASVPSHSLTTIFTVQGPSTTARAVSAIHTVFTILIKLIILLFTRRFRHCTPRRFQKLITQELRICFPGTLCHRLQFS